MLRQTIAISLVNLLTLPARLGASIVVVTGVAGVVFVFTALFAIGRLPGWIAHWIEMHASPNKKICRPRQIYTGPTEREFLPIEKRK